MSNIQLISGSDTQSRIVCELTETQLLFIANYIFKVTKEDLIEEAFADDVTDMLGLEYKDKISGLIGTVIMVGQTIDGNLEVLLQPKCLEDNKLPDQKWVDISRVQKV